jgi:POT family proton-dependent oligopeptide transporter
MNNTGTFAMVMQASGTPDAHATADAMRHPNRHPRGLYTLFFTEMWERASYYGMRALLVLFLASPVAAGGMGLDDKTAAAIYGIYTAAVYLFALPGGWVADRLLGMKKAVFYGGCIIAAGHFTLALPWTLSFYIGLVFIVLGTGLLKPCISGLVGELYADDTGTRRDAAFSIYYMGINLGAILGPLVCGWLGENINWHYGFAAAGIGMTIGLIQFTLSSRKHLSQVGGVACPTTACRKYWYIVISCMIPATVLIATVAAGYLPIDPFAIAAHGSIFIALLAAMYFSYVYMYGGISQIEKNRMKAFGVLFFASALFWAGFEQAGSSFNLFALRYTDRIALGYEIPASWLQSVNALFIIVLAPLFAAMWVRLGMRNLDPSSPTKFAIGIVLLGIGFGIMALAATFVLEHGSVLPTWLVLTYLFHTMGELCISPIGLSLVTKLAPRNYASQMMGLWFVSFSIGNLLAGVLAGHVGGSNIEQMPSAFGQLFWLCLTSAVILFISRKPLQRWMQGVH